jgi:hypothetical protein
LAITKLQSKHHVVVSYSTKNYYKKSYHMQHCFLPWKIKNSLLRGSLVTPTIRVWIILNYFYFIYLFILFIYNYCYVWITGYRSLASTKSPIYYLLILVSFMD